MNIKTEQFFSIMQDDTKIVVQYTPGEGWEVYYKRQGFPLLFAFGLPAVHSIGEVFDIGIKNIPQYEDLFE